MFKDLYELLLMVGIELSLQLLLLFLSSVFPVSDPTFVAFFHLLLLLEVDVNSVLLH